MQNYFMKLSTDYKPVWAFFITGIQYVMFPEKCFETAAVAVGVAIMLDILTKYMALSKRAGGFLKAVKKRDISSNSLWQGTSIKVFSYFVVFILAGLSYRVTMLTQASVFLATVVYTVIFLREAQSILENLCDAGADLQWLLVWTRKKEKQILEDDSKVNNKGSDDGDRI
jgi:phage-related holin